MSSSMVVWRVRSHIVCKVRTPMHAYMKHAMCEHICMQTGTMQRANTYAMCEHRCMQRASVRGRVWGWQERCNVRTPMHEGEWGRVRVRGNWGVGQLWSVAISLSRIREISPMHLWVRSHVGVRSHSCLDVYCSSLLFYSATVRCPAKQC